MLLVDVHLVVVKLSIHCWKLGATIKVENSVFENFKLNKKDPWLHPSLYMKAGCTFQKYSVHTESLLVNSCVLFMTRPFLAFRVIICSSFLAIYPNDELGNKVRKKKERK